MISKKIIVLICNILLSGCGNEAYNARPRSARPLISVLVDTNEGGGGYPGIVEARVSAAIGFRVLGNLNSRLVEVGDRVSDGAVLATLEASSQSLTVRAAEADLRNAQARENNARSSYDRQQTLAEAGLGTAAASEQAEQALRTARANVTKAEAILAKAREQLDYTVLRSQFPGIVTEVSAEVGQTVDAGASVITVARPDDREVVIDVPDEVYRRLTIGAPFDLRLQLDKDMSAQGIVREIAPSADQMTRTRRVRISLVSPGESFRIGTVVSAFLKRTEAGGVVIPTRALGMADEPFVWVVDEQASVVRRRPVEIAKGNSGDDETMVIRGLRVGERVAVAGVNRLADGEAVRLPKRNAL